MGVPRTDFLRGLSKKKYQKKNSGSREYKFQAHVDIRTTKQKYQVPRNVSITWRPPPSILLLFAAVKKKDKTFPLENNYFLRGLLRETNGPSNGLKHFRARLLAKAPGSC